MPRKPNFASYLRDARIKRRLSVVEVAEQVGVSTASIYFWETDRARPRDANLSALCKVLRLPVQGDAGDGGGISRRSLRDHTRLDCCPSPIDRIGCASHVAGAIGTQPHDHLGDLIWLAEPPSGVCEVICSARFLSVSAVTGIERRMFRLHHSRRLG